MSLPYRGSSGALTLLIDSTGIKSEGEGAWTARKHGGPKRRIWRKIHIGTLGRTLWRRWSGYHRSSRVETTLSGSCCA